MHANLRSGELQQLEAAVRAFAEDPRRFLAEAAQSLRQRRDPPGTLELLMRLYGGPYADRPTEKRALNDVGKWLERRLLREPRADVEQLLLELGWLQRITVILKPGTGDRVNSGQRQEVARAFGDRINQIRSPPARAHVSRAHAPASPQGLVSSRQQRVEALLKDLRPENAGARLPELLAEPDPVARQELAERCVGLLQRKRVREAQKADKAWVRPLTEILGKLT